MTISKPKIRDRQIPLWAGALDKRWNASRARNVCGDFFEDATAAATGAVRLRTDSTADICPDLKWSDRVFFEEKSVGVSDQAIIYSHRMRKDLDFCEENEADLHYFFWHHRSEVLNSIGAAELRATIAAEPIELIIAPIALVKLVCDVRPEKLLNTMKKTPNGKRLGFGSNGYGIGYNFPLSDLRGLCDFSFSVVRPVTVDGESIDRFLVRAATPAAIRFLKVTQ